ncbi:phage tail protein [Oceanobacillus arenosus]|uniref:Phage tail protein n=1 Tax=Oceanobacillus arenosus TaxID=1229153 RepID=A0A3D8PYE4_9BACI|nr:phage tail protein [Oceanobacillus arenosus]RDW21044.1 phage tail protein [Oceanobacillus arenosus]
MATELGQAYVQIMPSAKGIKGSIQKQFDPESVSAGKSAGSKLGASLKIAAVASVAAAGLALGKVISSSLSEGAALQQSLGGIETLFKDSGDKVKAFANEAYKTAGLSANDYMETVTSFSASLLQSMGGDTEAAADTANMALIDMSDNANKMGSSMESIQDAYKGFAKQNYTMLDNLSLGYGGTKTEMERLLADATKLTGVKYDINNLDDVYNAIHAVQEEMGITGTTAKESAETFSGSLDSMKASFSNVLGGLALGQDITPALNALAETTSTFLFNNFFPMVGNILKALPGAIITFAKAAGPLFMQAGQDFISNLSKGMSTGNLGFIFPILDEIINAISSTFSIITGFIMQIWGSLVAWWNANSAQILATAQTVWTTIMTTVNTIVQAVVAFVMQIWAGLVTFWQEHGQMILQAAQNVWNVISIVISTVMNVIWGIMQVLWPVIQALIVSVWNNIKGVIQGAISVITGIIQFFAALFTGNWSALWDSVKQILSGAVQLIWNLVQLWFVGKILKAGQALFTGLKGIVTNIWNAVKSLFSSGVNTARNVVSTGFNFIRNIVNTVMNAIRSVISNIWNGIRNTISNVVNGIRNTISNIFNSLRGIVSGAFSGVTGAVRTGIGNAYKAVTGKISDFFNAGKNIVGSIADGIKGAVGKVTGAISNITQKIRDFLPFSPPKTGPLIDIMDVKWGETIGAGITNGEDEVAKAMDDILNFDLTKKAQFNNPQNNYNNNNRDHLSSQQNQPIILQVDGKTFAQIMGDYTSAEGGNRIRRIERGLA